MFWLGFFIGAWIGISFGFILALVLRNLPDKEIEKVHNKEGKHTVYIATPRGEIIRANWNRKKNTIWSLTRGGIRKLRKYNWDIGKRR